jgi:hypothetical protein
MDTYAAELAALPNTIAARIDEYAEELRARITAPDYVSDMHELLGGQIHHLIFGGVEGDPGGRVWPLNKAEWVTLRAMPRFEQLLKDHCHDRLDVGFYEDPVQGMSVAVTAAIADIVAFRAIELNGGVNTELATERSTGRPATESITTPQG